MFNRLKDEVLVFNDKIKTILIKSDRDDNSRLNKKRSYDFAYYFGLPGAGKTTFAAYLAKKYQRRKIDVYSNVSIKNCYEIEKSDIGKYLISNGLLIKDEAGVEDNNRAFKTMTKEEIKFYKYHRHFRLDIAVFSQAHDDVDVVLRRLCNKMYYLKKSKIPFFIKRRELCKKIDINKDTHQIEVQYYWKFLGSKRIFSPLLWKMFDSHNTYDLPIKKFKKYA